MGAERFVVDDGWFRHRRSDDAGLGDWYVDETVWPDGLHKLVQRVREHGMQFGLWFEPEMANPDSDLIRAHPDWLLADSQRRPLPRRGQHTLNLARPDVYAWRARRSCADRGRLPVAGRTVVERTAAMRLPGLDPDAEYVVEVIPGEVSGPPDRHPGWASSQVRLTGRALAVVGLPAPRLADRPGTAFLFQCLRARAAEPGLGAPGVPSAAAGGGARMRLGKPCSCSPTCATAYPHSRIAY